MDYIHTFHYKKLKTLVIHAVKLATCDKIHIGICNTSFITCTVVNIAMYQYICTCSIIAPSLLCTIAKTMVIYYGHGHWSFTLVIYYYHTFFVPMLHKERNVIWIRDYVEPNNLQKPSIN